LRSDERSGAVFLVLIFLWGTLAAEPLHIYTHYIRKIVNLITGFLSLGTDSIMANIIVCVVIAASGCAWLKLSETSISPYIATVICGLTVIGLIINSLIDNSMSIIHLITCVVYLAILAFLHITKSKEYLLWASDVYICAHPVYLLANFMFVPISKLGKTVESFLYITRYKDMDLALPFDGLLHIHEAVWGSFIAVLAILPMIYFAMTRRKS